MRRCSLAVNLRGISAINDSINLRRHRNACRFYREKWDLEEVLYQCYCLRDTPPQTDEEQERCFTSKRGCWRDRLAAARRRASVGVH